VKKFHVTAATTLLFAFTAGYAQLIDNEAVVLPLEAQSCNLPVAPARIPEDADYERLKTGKAHVTAFQEKMIEYRECLDAAMIDSTLSDGNKTALANAHNYSVDMEERIAEQFNVAVRAYKARQENN